MARAKIVWDQDGRFYGVQFLCPGCLYSNGGMQPHTIPVRPVPPGEVESPHISWKDRWTWNGSLELPVFGPSLNTWWGGEHDLPLHRCHSWIGCSGAKPGQIQFLNDCTHHLKGQIVELPELD
jgi:hypothetical protein